MNSHMTKNSEWGAVAYLAHSAYGRNGKEISINLNEDGYTGGGEDVAYLTNTNQSTTGNVYGIYDMSGGAEEYVMGNMLDSSNQLYPRSCGTWTTTNAPLDKYYDKYSYKSGSTGRREYSRGRLGDATVELSPASYKSWYDDGSNFVGTSASSSTTYYPWFMRGGQFTGATSAGLFNFTNRHGIGNTNYGSRSVLAIAE